MASFSPPLLLLLFILLPPPLPPSQVVVTQFEELEEAVPGCSEGLGGVISRVGGGRLIFTCTCMHDNVYKKLKL